MSFDCGLKNYKYDFCDVLCAGPKGHFEEAFKSVDSFGDRVVTVIHFCIATLELIPIIGQIAYLFESVIVTAIRSSNQEFKNLDLLPSLETGAPKEDELPGHQEVQKPGFPLSERVSPDSQESGVPLATLVAALGSLQPVERNEASPTAFASVAASSEISRPITPPTMPSDNATEILEDGRTHRGSDAFNRSLSSLEAPEEVSQPQPQTVEVTFTVTYDAGFENRLEIKLWDAANHGWKDAPIRMDCHGVDQWRAQDNLPVGSEFKLCYATLSTGYLFEVGKRRKVSESGELQLKPTGATWNWELFTP